MKSKGIRARELIIIGIIAAAIALGALGYQIYRDRYNDLTIRTGNSVLMKFNKSQAPQQSWIAEIAAKGTLKWGVMQDYGNNTCQYDIYCRKAEASTYVPLKIGLRGTKNHIYGGPIKQGKVKKANSKYVYVVTKTHGKVASALYLDLLLI